MEERHEHDGRKGRNFSARWWSRETIVGAALGPIGGKLWMVPPAILTIWASASLPQGLELRTFSLPI